MYPLHSLRNAFDRNGLIPGDVSSYLTGAAISASDTGIGAAIDGVTAKAKAGFATDDYASGVQQDHGIGNGPSPRIDVETIGRNLSVRVRGRDHNTDTAEKPNAHDHRAASLNNVVAPPSLVHVHAPASSWWVCLLCLNLVALFADVIHIRHKHQAYTSAIHIRHTYEAYISDIHIYEVHIRHFSAELRVSPPRTHYNPDAQSRATSFSMSSYVVFKQVSSGPKYLNEGRQDEAVSRGKTNDSSVVQVLAGHEEEPASRSKTDGPVLQFLSKPKKLAQI